ncbi:MAG: DUF2339 domain-containing protein [Acidimicrobiia bacterium]
MSRSRLAVDDVAMSNQETPVTADAPVQSAPAQSAPAQSAPARSKPADLLSARAIFRLGLFLVLSAVAFFLRYSFEQGWIGPTARVGLAASAGMAMIVTGIQISTRRPAYGNVLQGGGAAVLYLTAFAAHQRYAMIDSTGAFLLLGAISAAVVGMALRQSSQPLAISGVAGALIAPVAVGGRIDVFPGDTGYLLAVLGVASWLFLARRWSWLFASAAAGVGFVLSIDTVRMLFGSSTVSALEVQTGITALWAVGWGVAIVGAIRNPGSVDTATVIPVAATTTLPLFGALATLAVWDIAPGDPAWMAVSLGLAAVHTIAFVALRSTRAPSMTAAVQLVPASLLAVLAWAGGLEGAGLLAAIAAQAAVMVMVGIRAKVAPLALTGHLLAGVVSSAWAIVVLTGGDATFGATDIWTGVVVVISSVLAFLISGEDEPHATLSQVYGALSLTAALGWAAVSLGPLPSGAGLVTGIWALIGIALIVKGQVDSADLIRNLGIGVVLLAVAKLLLIDLGSTSPLVRIGLFSGIGVALLVVGYWLGSSEDEHEPVTPVE